MGIYPEISLVQAREDTKEARKLLRVGVDPSSHRKAIKQTLMEQHNKGKSKQEALTTSFEVIAREWGQCKVNDWENPTNRSRRMLERNIFPWLGKKQITEIKAVDILGCLRRVEDRGAIETAHRVLQICGQVCRYAVATGRAERDITPDLKGALRPAKGGNFAALTDAKQLTPLLMAIDEYNGSFVVKCALQLAPLVFVRPGELRNAEWGHIDLDGKEWRYLESAQ